MPILIIDNVPVSLYDQIQHLSRHRHCTPADTVIAVLETAFRSRGPIRSDVPLCNEMFLTEELSAPCALPRPEGKPAHAERVPTRLPEPHDMPTEA